MNEFVMLLILIPFQFHFLTEFQQLDLTFSELIYAAPHHL